MPRTNDQLQAATLRLIALFEAIKGIAAVCASLGLLSLSHHDIQAMAHALIDHFHLNPESYYPRVLLDQATLMGNANVTLVMALLWVYSGLRLSEAYGLWRNRAWAEWLAALSGGVYLPLEVSHLLQRSSWINVRVLALNIAVVSYMVVRMMRRRSAYA
jgi:uncharacterized membrane protein (DUF2068 family)